MCGIIHVKRIDGKSPVKMAIKRYEAQKERGTEGFGYIVLNKGVIVEYARAEKEKEIMAKLKKHENKCDEVIFHHRYPTSTPNFASAAHPIKVSNPLLKHDYYVIHNGIIYNDEKLKTKHEALGFTYNTELVEQWKSQNNTVFEQKKWNDSEALAIELAMDFEKDGDGIDVRGSIAFIALQTDKNSRQARKLYFGRNTGSPLRLDIAKQHFIALTSIGQGRMVESDKLISFDYKTKIVDEREYIVGDDYVSYSGYGYNRGYNDHDDDEMYGAKTSARTDDTDLSDENDYMEAQDEYATCQKKLSDMDAQGIDSQERDELEVELFRLEEKLADYEQTHFNRAIAQY